VHLLIQERDKSYQSCTHKLQEGVMNAVKTREIKQKKQTRQKEKLLHFKKWVVQIPLALQFLMWSVKNQLTLAITYHLPVAANCKQFGAGWLHHAGFYCPPIPAVPLAVPRHFTVQHLQ
jgi:hypothetical protein